MCSTCADSPHIMTHVHCFTGILRLTQLSEAEPRMGQVRHRCSAKKVAVAALRGTLIMLLAAADASGAQLQPSAPAELHSDDITPLATNCS